MKEDYKLRLSDLRPLKGFWAYEERTREESSTNPEYARKRMGRGLALAVYDASVLSASFLGAGLIAIFGLEVLLR